MAGQQKQNPRAKAAAAAKQLRYTIISRMAKALQHEFSLISNFKQGYRNKEDISTLPPFVLAVGSQNVLTNNGEQVAVRNGYQLDGAASTQNTYGIDSGYDFNTHSLVGVQNTRKWGPNLQVRYTNPVTKVTTWITIQSNLTPTNVCNFTSYFDGTIQVCLYVNGDNNVNRWTGGVGSFLSATSTTIKISGTNALPTLNFDAAGSLIIDGVTYAYTSAGITPSTAFSQNPTNNKIPLVPGTFVSQLFTTGATASTITKATVNLNFTGTTSFPINYRADIYTDNAGVPGTSVGHATTGSDTIPGSGDAQFVFTFNTLNVNPATNYHLVIQNINGFTTGDIYTGNTGSTGTNQSLDSGTTWAPINGYMNAIIIENDSPGTTFSGVTPDPTLAGISVGDAVIQAPSIGLALIAAIPQPFNISLIDTFRNQVYYGSLTNNVVYISKVNNYTDCTFSTPRVVGEGASVVLDAPPAAFIAQSDGEYMSAGRDFWYRTKFTLSADLAKESFEIDRLKTTANQGAVSQSYVSKYKNSISYVSFESIFNLLGPVKNILADPQVVNISDSIRNDMNAYTFVGGSVAYSDFNIFFSAPKQGVVRIWNINNKYWEVPQTMPVGIFYQVNGVLYGHDSTTDQSYQLFVPNLYRDNETPINAIAAFPYVSSEGAQPNQLKFFNKHYTEGYIAGNTTLTLQFNYDFGAFSGTYSVGISGADKRVVFSKLTDGSLGTDTLGNQPIGTILNLPNQPPIPKFRIVNTFPPTNAYEVQTIFSSYAMDANWVVLRFGPAIGPARDTQAGIQE